MNVIEYHGKMLSKGVTLITLAVTIAIIILVSGITVYTAIDLIAQAKLTKFNTELKIIHTKVNELIAEERPEDELNSLGLSIASLDEATQEKIQTAMQGASTTGFRYFNGPYLETIGVLNVEREVLINFTTREVIDINGIEKEGSYIYRVEGWYDIAHNS